MNSDKYTDSTGTFDWVPTGTGVKLKDGGISLGTDDSPAGTPIAGTITTKIGILGNGAASGIGYGTGAGSTVTQITSISTAVTINAPTGTITTFAAGAAAGAEDGPFTVNCSPCAATDIPVVAIKSYGGTGTPQVFVSAVAAGSFAITITNLHASSALNAAIVISYALIKGVAA